MIEGRVENALFGLRSASDCDAGKCRAPRLCGSGSHRVDIPPRPFLREVVASAGDAYKRDTDAHRDRGGVVRGEGDPPARPGTLRVRAAGLRHAVVLPRTACADVTIELRNEIDGEFVRAAAKMAGRRRPRHLASA